MKMFDKKTVDAYKMIQPSPQLAQRIADLEASGALEKQKPLKFPALYRCAGIAAACIVLVLALTLPAARTPARTALYAEGQAGTAGYGVPVLQPNAQIRAFALASQDDTLTIPLTLAAVSNTTLSVSAGTLLCCDAQSGEALDPAQTPEGEIQLYWTVPMPDTQAEARLYAEAQEETLCYLLYFDASENQWMICQENEKE